ncbi:MAG: DUF1566 domain-containing protein [Planctomycetota bacterium]
MATLTWCLAGADDKQADKAGLTYPIVDTMQTYVFSDRGQLTREPRPGQAFYGQDAQFKTHAARYRDNRDGTIDDLVTGLTWLKKPYTGKKLTFAQATAATDRCRVGGHRDWRLPSIKELYSLIDFNGDVRATTPVPYIDTEYFEFTYGSGEGGERQIDAQYWSSTQYVGTTMNGAATVFGVNFADGRIKGYPKGRTRRGTNTMWTLYCRGNPAYGKNRFVENGDGTISDLATGLMWMKGDSGKTMNWEDALAWCEKLELAGHSDWHLPDAKQLQSIVDYTRAPRATDRTRRGPAIDPIFTVTKTESYYWTGTTHIEGERNLGTTAVYVCFGRSMGNMRDPRTGRTSWMDVHGAGAQRSDPKSGNPDAPQYRNGRGPQGDDIRIFNYVRAVRLIDPEGIRPAKPSLEELPAHQHTRPEGQRPGETDRDDRRRPGSGNPRPPTVRPAAAQAVSQVKSWFCSGSPPGAQSTHPRCLPVPCCGTIRLEGVPHIQSMIKPAGTDVFGWAIQVDGVYLCRIARPGRGSRDARPILPHVYAFRGRGFRFPAIHLGRGARGVAGIIYGGGDP